MAKKTKKPVLLEPGHTDEIQTPAYAIEPLLPYIPKSWIVWECACGKGNLVDAFIAKGYKVVWSDIARDPSEDFLTCKLKSRIGCIVTNPPYSIKNDFIRRCYEIGKPFALLMPLTALETAERQYYYRTRGLQLILLDKRIDFEMPSGKGSSSWFSTAWFTYGLNLPHDMMFARINKENDIETDL